MTKVIIFGGTAEGRMLCEFCAAHAIRAVYCAATEDGVRPVKNMPGIDARAGRLDIDKMAAILREYAPAPVFDATHPYAEEVSGNIAAACGQSGAELIRIRRDSPEEPGCVYFGGYGSLLTWLENEPGNIFATTGSSSASQFAKLPDYADRVWMRILPNINSLQTCLDNGFRPERLICMYGPFSEELNAAMFRGADAAILVTKASGVPGGFPEKVRAARKLGMAVAVLSKPAETGGVTLDEARRVLLNM